MLYVVGGADENEILLYNVVLALRDSLNILLKSESSCPGLIVVIARLIDPRNSIDRRALIENYDLVSLAVDEICDSGIVLETDPVVIASRVSRPPTQDVASVKGIDLSEQGLLNAWEFAKMKAQERLRQGL